MNSVGVGVSVRVRAMGGVNTHSQMRGVKQRGLYSHR